MKCFKHLLLLFGFSLLLTAPACKKENKEPPFGASGLDPGRAAIKFTTDKSINGSRSFEVRNTSHTSAQNKSMNVGDIRNVLLEAIDVSDNIMHRKAYISLVLRHNTTPTINLSLTSGLPLASIYIESYGWFGYTRRSQSGTLTVTRFTATEVEGRFSVTYDDGTTTNDGRFAGKF